MHLAAVAYALPAGDDAALVRRFTGSLNRLSRGVARRVGRPDMAGDLWTAGALGLLDAAGRFDPARGIRFETFAEHRMRGAMLDEARHLDHLPRRMRAAYDQANRTRRSMSHRLGREPSDAEVAAELGLDVEELGRLEGAGSTPVPLEALVEQASEAAGPDQVVDEAAGRRRLAAAVGELPERLRILLGLHYLEGLTYKEIGTVLKVSEPRVCQLHTEAVGKLRELLKAA